MVRFMNYPDAWPQIVDVHWVFKLDIALGLFIFIFFPFTRLVNMLSVLVRYLWRAGYQIVRSRKMAERPVGDTTEQNGSMAAFSVSTSPAVIPAQASLAAVAITTRLLAMSGTAAALARVRRT
jgi:hypothetical protein